MNKIVFAVIALLAFGVGWYLFTPETIEYTAVVEDEVVALEAELVALEAAVTAGTLSRAAANEARSRIIATIESITTAAAESGKATLTDVQRTQLQDGLERLKNVLLQYQSTLVAVDVTAGVTDAAVVEGISAGLNRGGSGRDGSLSAIVAEALVAIEVSVDEVIDEVVSDAEIEELLDESEELVELTEDGSGEPMIEDDTGADEQATTSDDVITDTEVESDMVDDTGSSDSGEGSDEGSASSDEEVTAGTETATTTTEEGDGASI